ncbi:MAG: M23 family metallopeptidase [Bacteroidia bacterium]|nr:M23 family metallopeptidase [Bacteroidia bacterium]
MDKKRPKRKLLIKLKNRYRLLIINETNFQEKSSVSLTPFNVILLVSAGLILFFLISWGIFTLFPTFRDYTPGYSNTGIDGKMKNEVLNKLDKYEKKMTISGKRELALRQIIEGKDVTAYDLPYRMDDKGKKNAAKQEIAVEQPTNNIVKDPIAQQPERIFEAQDHIDNSYLFFTPLRGRITSKFDFRNHPAVDIVPEKDESIKAALEGTVIFAAWTPDNGYVITIQHMDNWISSYKHNAVLYKSEGEFVSSGETIAMVGNTGELSSGPHLHLELWHNGHAVDPESYIPF